METTAILRSILHSALKTDDVWEIRDAIKVMCSDDDVAAVEKKIREAQERAKK